MVKRRVLLKPFLDRLRACIINLPGNEEKQMLLVDFDYNNSFDTSILMAPYEAL